MLLSESHPCVARLLVAMQRKGSYFVTKLRHIAASLPQKNATEGSKNYRSLARGASLCGHKDTSCLPPGGVGSVGSVGSVVPLSPRVPRGPRGPLVPPSPKRHSDARCTFVRTRDKSVARQLP